MLSLLDGNIFINTDYIIGAQQTQYISRTLTSDSSSYNLIHGQRDTNGSASSGGSIAVATVTGPGTYHDQSTYVEVMATASPSEVRTIVVTIPSGAGPGSILTVAAPNGTTISVSYLRKGLCCYLTVCWLFAHLCFRWLRPKVRIQEKRSWFSIERTET